MDQVRGPARPQPLEKIDSIPFGSPMKTFKITSRIDAVTGIPPRYQAATLPAPRAVKIELTSQCNYRCGFCAHRLRMKKRGEMRFRNVREPLHREPGVEIARDLIELIGISGDDCDVAVDVVRPNGMPITRAALIDRDHLVCFCGRRSDMPSHACRRPSAVAVEATTAAPSAAGCTLARCRNSRR